MSDKPPENPPPAEEARKRAKPESSRSVIVRLAQKYGVDDDKLFSTLKATAFRQGRNSPEATNEQMMALLVVADQYNLNPFTRELYAFPDKSKGIVPIVSLDGWVRIINEHEKFEGAEFIYSEEMFEETPEHPECPVWIETVIYRSDRKLPWRIREYFDECYVPPRQTENGPWNGPWQTHPKRFLRHKSLIQCGRLAFGFAGIYDPDEAERIADAMEQPAVSTDKATTRGDEAREALRRALPPPGSNVEQAQADAVLKSAVRAKQAEPVRAAAAAKPRQQSAEEWAEREPVRTPVKEREPEREPEPQSLLPDEDELPPLTEAEFVPALKAATTLDLLRAVWGQVLDFYDRKDTEVPFEIEDVFQMKKEKLQ